MNFKSLSLISGIVLLSVSLVLLFIPSLILEFWDVNPLPEATFMGRRISMAFLGMGLICILARNLPQSESRKIISVGLLITFGSISILGFTEYFRGYAGLGIILVATFEMLGAIGFYVLGVKSKT
ncbi:hypothetical protein N9Y48_02365 [Zobellia sp.]|nr:hypothetical protein [Zobellia sp.]